MWSPIPRKSSKLKRLGLIINPVAGIGGSVGLKGSDGLEIQKQALELGAVQQAGKRAALVLQRLGQKTKDLEILTPPGEMGEAVVREAGFDPRVLGEITPGETSPDDTTRGSPARAHPLVW